MCKGGVLMAKPTLTIDLTLDDSEDSLSIEENNEDESKAPIR